MSATVFAKSNNTNMMLIGALYDVAPDGTREQISIGLALGSQTELDLPASWKDASGTMVWPWPKLDKDKYLTPGRVYKVEMALKPRQWGILPNHHLEFELTTQSPSSICPAPPAMPRGGSEPCGMTDPQEKTVPGGVYDILYGPQTPTALNLPQLPAKYLVEARSGVMPREEPPATPASDANANANVRRPPAEDLILPLDWGLEAAQVASK
jgi:predicted acyl esterase